MVSRVSALGLSAWICLSRDLDVIGVVQRADALRKATFELCGLHMALERVWCLAGALSLSGASMDAIEDARTEVTCSSPRSSP